MRRCDEAHSLFKDKLQNDILDEDIAGGDTAGVHSKPPEEKELDNYI